MEREKELSVADTAPVLRFCGRGCGFVPAGMRPAIWVTVLLTLYVISHFYTLSCTLISTLDAP